MSVPPEEPRRRFEPLFVVLAVVAAGLVLTWFHHPRRGVFLLAAAVGLATVLRAVLRPRDVGLLAVRSRLADVTVLLLLTAALLLLASVTPFPGPAR